MNVKGPFVVIYVIIILSVTLSYETTLSVFIKKLNNTSAEYVIKVLALRVILRYIFKWIMKTRRNTNTNEICVSIQLLNAGALQATMNVSMKKSNHINATFVLRVLV
jgi:hypothetical protein